MIRMSRNVSILGVVVVMTVTVLATVAVAFAVPGEGSNGQAKFTICHKGHVTISVAEPAWSAHAAHGDTMGACVENEEALPEEPSEDATPTLTTDASNSGTTEDPAATLGKTPAETINDVATLDVPDSTTGTIEFKLYGPFDTSEEITATSCVDPDPEDPTAEHNRVYTDTVTVPTDEDPAGSGEYPSGSYTPTEPGYYQWVATFTSGTEGVDQSSTPCGDTTEQSLVTDATSTAATEQYVTLAGENVDDANPADPATDTTNTEGTIQNDNTSAGTDNEDDDLYGDASANILLGRHGNDYLEGGQGPDRMVGGKQGDFVIGADGKPANDVINGGIGTDYCVGDVRDEFRNCDGNVAKVPVPPQSAAP
jgi:RTX calcium-binding nonapeptide repeat (4 copies)